MGIHRKTLAVTATVLSLAGGGDHRRDAPVDAARHAAHDPARPAPSQAGLSRRGRARAGGATRSSRPDRSPSESLASPIHGEIAQLVEHTTENRGVPGSSPGLATSEKSCKARTFRFVRGEQAAVFLGQ
jgi:hypothetical protein